MLLYCYKICVMIGLNILVLVGVIFMSEKFECEFEDVLVNLKVVFMLIIGDVID